MYRRFQDRFGMAGVIIAVVALIAALSGTALAASGALTGKQKKEVEKIAKKYAGKPGAPGAAGANGTNGTNGKDGANGSPGAAGTGATVASFTGSKGTCTKGQGGIEVKSASATTFVCNGEEGDPGESPSGTPFAGNAEPTGNPCNGAGGFTYTVEGVPSNVCNGKEGSPWTASGTLPPGATETGSWGMQGEGMSFGISGRSGVDISAPISFSIPLAPGTGGQKGITANHVHFSEDSDFAAACTGTLDKPTAKPGELCVYEGISSGVPSFDAYKPNTNAEGASASGSIIVAEVTTPAAGGFAFGTFAVTGCSTGVGAQFPCP
jgi:hypothetical protein